jgi:hypothetical protein
MDDDFAARVLQEYASLGAVTEREIERLLAPGPTRPLSSYREAAIALRVSTILEVRDPFALPPLYQFAREMIDHAQNETDDVTRWVLSLLAEALCVGADLAASERESILLSTFAAILPDGHHVDEYLAAIDRRVIETAMAAARPAVASNESAAS